MKLLLIVILMVLLSSAAGSAPLTVEEYVKVAAPRISFADLLAPEDGAEDRAYLVGIDLGPAPGKGEVRYFSRQYLQYLLRREGVDPQDFYFPDQVAVESNLQKITGVELEESIRDLLAEKKPEIIIDFSRGMDDIYYPAGELELMVEMGNNLRIPGNNTLNLELFIEGESWEKIRVAAFLDQEIELFRAGQDLGSGDIITTDCLVEDRVLFSQAPTGFIDNHRDLEGYRVRRSLQAGTIICSHHLEEVPLVERGDRVTLELIQPGFAISLPGEAMQSGNPGSEILVRNLFSGGTMRGRVTDRGTIEIKK